MHGFSSWSATRERQAFVRAIHPFRAARVRWRVRALLLCVLLSSALVLAFGHSAASAESKPRVIVTTDGEGDDIASMHRFLLYVNDFDVDGIISSSSRWHWAGDPSATPPIAENNWHGTEWIPQLIDGGYRQAYPRLYANDRRYPRPEKLLDVVKTGNVTMGGEMQKDTEGSELIKKALLDNKPGQVQLQAWGGTNTIAAALRSIRDDYYGTRRWKAIEKKVSDKASLYLIQDQDRTYKDYISSAWPDVRVIVNRDQFEAFAYGSWSYTPQPLLSYFQKDFISANIQKGPLGPTYPVHNGTEGASLCWAGCADGDWFSEGDSPSFLHAIPTGLRQLEDPTYGGWGGRFLQTDRRRWADIPRYLGVDRDKATDLSPYPILKTTLAAPTATGASNVKATRVRMPATSGVPNPTSDFIVGDRITVGSGANAERRTVTKAGGGGATPTTLFDAAPAGSTNVKVASTSFWFPGDPMTIGTGAAQEQVTVKSVGTARVATTASAAADEGATVLKLGSTGASCNLPTAVCFTDPVMKPGDEIRIGTGDALFTATIKKVGTPGPAGTGLTLEEPLPRPVTQGTTIVNPGSGITFSPALSAAHPAGDEARTIGGGLTLDRPLTRNHAAGDALENYNSPGWPQARWTDAIQNDMAARIGWTTKSYRQANHQPVPSVKRREMFARAGRRVELSGSATDPDGDKLRFNWYQYEEAGSYRGKVRLNYANSRRPSFVIPRNAEPGDTLHFVMAVTDKGSPPLTRYERVVVTVKRSGR